MKFFKIKFVLVFCIVITNLGCKKEAPSVTESSEYYIKYEIQSNSSPYHGVKLNTNIKNEQNQTINEIINIGSWETTIGPVKKGFISSLKVEKNGWSGSNEYHLKMTLSISVSKNGAPFAQKKLDDNNNNARATASIEYNVE
jgi:hypothetical protein